MINNPLAIDNPVSCDSFSECLISMLDIVVLVATPIVVLMVVYSGFLFVTAGGNAQKITRAKITLLWTLVGALILLGADVIVSVVFGTVASVSA